MWIEETVHLRCIYGKPRKTVNNRTLSLNNGFKIVTLLLNIRTFYNNRKRIIISQLYLTISVDTET